jgi:hypothetical protein
MIIVAGKPLPGMYGNRKGELGTDARLQNEFNRLAAFVRAGAP